MFVCFHMESSRNVRGRFAEGSLQGGLWCVTCHPMSPIFKSFLTKAHSGHTFEIG